MGHSLATFDTLPWTSGAHPLEQKKVAAGGLSLLQFEPGFSDPNLCERSHVLFVLQGTLQLELADETVAVGPGQAIWLEAGTSHRAVVSGGAPALVFAASDFERQTT